MPDKQQNRHLAKLIAQARRARQKAYAPYSKFKVGAVLEANGGKVYLGCNVENTSSGVSVCAERVALLKAVSEGVKKFRRLVIVADTKKTCSPCGICRQALFEFAPGLEVVMANLKGKVETVKLAELLKHPYRRDM